MKPRSQLTAGLGAIIAAVLLVSAPRASSRDRDDCKTSQDCARDAFQSGEIRPLAEVIAAARAKVPGEVVKVELEREHGVWVYEIKILTSEGRRREVEIDAKTLEIRDVD